MRIVALLLLAVLAAPAPADAFSVLAHQAVVDRSWDGTIAPEIRRRFPAAALDADRARSFAYGGSHVADLGYFPLGDTLFTELLHYVRTGDFIRALLAAARDPNEYAFALGALAHYVADTTGHPEATNKIVAQLYPELREEFGERVTYADDHGAHLQTEFRFDVLQMARAKGGQDLLHHSLQFEVATRPLDEAFHQTYGLRLDDLFESTDAAILTYRWAFRGMIHEATGIAWELYRAQIQELDPTMTPAGFVYDLSRKDFEREFGDAYARPGYFARFVGFLTKLVPDVGPLRRAIFKPLPPEVQREFLTTLDRVVARYQSTVKSLAAKHPDLPAVNLDTGATIAHGDYPPADEAYQGLVEKLAGRDAAAVSAALRADLRRFYRGAPPTDADARRSGVVGRAHPRYANSSSSP
jgi:hypothetical protein